MTRHDAGDDHVDQWHGWHATYVGVREDYEVVDDETIGCASEPVGGSVMTNSPKGRGPVSTTNRLSVSGCPGS